MCLLERSRNWIEWTPLHLCVRKGNIDAISLLLAAGASPSLKSEAGRTPLHYSLEIENKRVLPTLLRGGAPLPRIQEIQDWGISSRAQANRRYIEKVAAAGSWAAYEKQHRARLVRTFVPKFPRLPPDVIPTIVAFGFHTGDY